MMERIIVSTLTIRDEAVAVHELDREISTITKQMRDLETRRVALQVARDLILSNMQEVCSIRQRCHGDYYVSQANLC